MQELVIPLLEITSTAGVPEMYRSKYGLKSQLLHAYRLEIPEIEGRLSYLSGKEFTAPLPYLFQKILKEEHVEENK